MTGPDYGSLDGLRVKHASLEEAASNMYETVKKMDASLNALESDIKNDVATWSGEQRQAYDSAKAAWDWAMQELRDLLDNTHSTVYQSNADYMQADKRGAGRF
ncbi:WXG100 family type VII secretion target [Nocardioides humi]|uniref:ESAT-6-like protein n=1 Tax=Nocardioides humi TaxID=449461 RepID=A0ABN2A5G2_9ACTN|nr:WXG100 family type VII secretion target [Nocardioides humi]